MVGFCYQPSNSQIQIRVIKSKPLALDPMIAKSQQIACIVVLLLSLASSQQHPQGLDGYEATRQTSQTMLSATQQRKQQEYDQVRKLHDENQFNEEFREFSFEVDGSDYKDFHISLPVDHKIFFNLRVYVLNENVYAPISQIETEPSVRLTVYQNNHMIVAEKDFYFVAAFSIDGKKDSTYLLRFYSPTSKLVVVSHSVFRDASHFQGKVNSEKMQQYESQLARMENKLAYVTRVLKTTHRVEFGERELLTRKFDTFSTYEIIEMLILIVLTGLQVKMVGRLFKSDSIV